MSNRVTVTSPFKTLTDILLELPVISQLTPSVESQLPTETENNNTLCSLLQELETLHRKISTPQTINIVGLDNIQFNHYVCNSKDKIDTLFFEADIPLYWILHVEETLPECKKSVSVIHVTLINYYVKEKTKDKLTWYLTKTYKNRITFC